MIPDRSSSPDLDVASDAWTRERLEAWIRGKAAEVLGKDPDDIDVDRTFHELGFDSVMFLCVAGELEILLHRELREDLLRRYPTVSLLALHLSTPGAEEIRA